MGGQGKKRDNSPGPQDHGRGKKHGGWGGELFLVAEPTATGGCIHTSLEDQRRPLGKLQSHCNGAMSKGLPEGSVKRKTSKQRVWLSLFSHPSNAALLKENFARQ